MTTTARIPIRLGSLFSGYGGLDLGVAGAIDGVRTVWHCENDPAASTVLAAASRGVANLGDITTVDWDQVPGVDVLTGGFPCQDLSVAGARAGLAGARSGLWSHMAAAIDALQPGLVVIENVKGILNAPTNCVPDSGMEPCPWCVGDTGTSPVRALGAVLADLSGLGYDAVWTTVAAADVGAPHRRERVFICAFPAADSGRGRAHGALRTILQRVRSTPGRGRHDAGRLPHRTNPPVTDANVQGLQGRYALEHPDQWSPWKEPMDTTGWVEPHSWGCPACGGIDPDCAGCNFEYRLGHGWGEFEPAIRHWELLTGREAPPAYEQGRHLPRLCPVFVEWMMGLPRWYVCDEYHGLTRTQQLRLLGNGVVPAQAAHALSLLLPTIDTAHPQAVTAA